MPAVLSKLRMDRPVLPADIIFEIACLLDSPSRRALLLSHSVCHFAVAPVMYRSIDVAIRTPDASRADYMDPYPFSVLTGLVTSMRPRSGIPPRCNPQHLVTFAYLSYGIKADLRAIPLVGAILRVAGRLRHLRIDVASEAVPMTLDVLRRTGVIITPISALTHSSLDVDANPDILPYLRSVRSSKLPIVEALMRYRHVNTVVVDGSPEETTLAKFLRTLPPWNPVDIRKFAITYCGYASFTDVVRGIFTAFPNIECFEFRLTGSVGLGFLLEAIDLLDHHPSLGSRLQVLAVNHAYCYGSIILNNLMDQLKAPDVRVRLVPQVSHLPCSLSVFEEFLLGAPEQHVDAFLAGFSPDAIMGFRNLSSSMLRAIDAYMTRKWSIAHTLRWWIWNIKEFLAVLDECDGIVSGSAAQHFFGREEYEAKDLDIYLPFHGLLPMGRFLQREGFKFQPGLNHHPFFDAAVMALTAFIGRTLSKATSDLSGHTYAFKAFNFALPQHSHPGKRGRRVQLIAVQGDPVEFMIRSFHSTAVMNYLTGKYAVSLFPRTTFIHRATLVCQDITRQAAVQRAWMDKYRARGFSVVGATHELPDTTEGQVWKRRVGDKLCWVLPYARTGMLRQELPAIRPWAFEVLDMTSGVVAAQAAVRVAPRFYYSSLAHIKDPAQAYPDYRSIETATAFLNRFWHPSQTAFNAYIPQVETNTDEYDSTSSADEEELSDAQGEALLTPGHDADTIIDLLG
ncbi:hypothetical protein C8T65DRAFT_746138 [Cerioporus squamosus]|nr:hypothetical protein C8T65DRAFT_746138 [Cerioporus squamosus]